MMTTTQQHSAALIGRILLALIFIISGWGKLTGFSETVDAIAGKELPMPQVLAVMAIAIELGSVHAMSHPAGAQFGVPHGMANAIHLPHVIRFNAEGGPDIADRYRDIADLFDVDGPEALADHVAGVVERLGLPTRLSQVGVPEEGIPALVEGAMGDGTTLLNPREPSEEDYAELYRRAL